MEREVASTIYLTITLVAIAALISIVFVTVIVGKEAQSEFYIDSSDLVDSTKTSQLSSLYFSDKKVMPTAAVYAILSKEYEGVKSITFYKKLGTGATATWVETTVKPDNGGWAVSGGETGVYTFPQDFLCDKLEGKVEVSVNYDSAYATYDIIMKEL